MTLRKIVHWQEMNNKRDSTYPENETAQCAYKFYLMIRDHARFSICLIRSLKMYP